VARKYAYFINDGTNCLKNNQPEIVLGSGGSNRIRTAILQVISNIVDFKMHVDVAE